MLTINTNIMAQNVARNFSNIYGDLAISTNRLSTGLRINTSADDAAGLAISELMRTEIAALTQGIRNAGDAQSLLYAADGALSIIDEKLIRMKELAEQAATGTYDDTQRTIIHNEFVTMRSEIDRIAQSTRFNQVQLINGNLTENGGLKVHFGPTNNSTQDYYYITIGSATSTALGLGGGSGTGGGPTTESYNLSRAEILAANPGFIEITFDPGAGPSTWNADLGRIYPVTPEAIRSEFAEQDFFLYSPPDNSSAPFYAVLTDGSGLQRALRYSWDEGEGEYSYLGEGGFTVRGTRTVSNGEEESPISVATQEEAQKALIQIDKAVESKDTIRANIGAYINRLSNTISQLSIQRENIMAAESRVRDADIALEMTSFVNNQIRSQAAIAMLSQANMLPQMALTLIGA